MFLYSLTSFSDVFRENEVELQCEARQANICAKGRFVYLLTHF